MDVSGGTCGVVNIVPHDLSLWRHVIRRVEIESLTFGKSMKLNKVKPSLTMAFVGGKYVNWSYEKPFHQYDQMLSVLG